MLYVLSKNGQMILDLSKRMGSIGIFNMDQKPENYTVRSAWDIAIGHIDARMTVLCNLLNIGNKYYKKETTFANMRLKF